MEPLPSKLISHRWLQMLADSNQKLESCNIKEATVALTNYNNLDKRSLNKALLGLAIKWENSFSSDGIDLAKHLLAAGADPNFAIIVQECYCNGANAQYKTSEVLQSISVRHNANGELKKYLESLKK